jgi:hypothetical protein
MQQLILFKMILEPKKDLYRPAHCETTQHDSILRKTS